MATEHVNCDAKAEDYTMKVEDVKATRLDSQKKMNYRIREREHEFLKLSDDLKQFTVSMNAASRLPWKVRGRLVHISPMCMSSQMTATGSFAISFATEERDYDVYSVIFNDFYSQHNAEPLTNAQVGSYCAFYKNHSWLRGVIMRVAVQHCLVAAMDTGLELCLNHDQLFRLASDFIQLPFALRCAYPRSQFLFDVGVPPLSAFKVGDEVKVTVISAYEPCLAVLEKDEGPAEERLIIEKSRLSPEPDDDFAWKCLMHKPMKGLPTFSFASGPEPTGSDFNAMVVCRFVSPDEFYVRDIGQTLRVAVIRELMSDSYDDTVKLNDLTFPNTRALKPGLACAVYNDEHMMWARSVVKEVSTTDEDDRETTLEAMSIDYGWLMESVPVMSVPTRFAMLRMNLTRYPAQLHRVAVNRSTLPSYENRHRYKKEDEIMRELLPIGTVVLIKGVAPRKKGADLNYSIPVVMKLPHVAQLTARRDETIWQTVERIYDERKTVEKVRKPSSKDSSDGDWSPNRPSEFGRDRLRSSTPEPMSCSPERQYNGQQQNGQQRSLQQQQNGQQQSPRQRQQNGQLRSPQQLQNHLHEQRNRSPGAPIMRSQVRKQPQELPRVDEGRGGSRMRSPSPSPRKWHQPTIGHEPAFARGAAAVPVQNRRQASSVASPRILGFGRGVLPDSPDRPLFSVLRSPAIRRPFSSSHSAGDFRQHRGRLSSLTALDRPPSQEDDVELAFLDRTSTSVMSAMSDDGVNFSKTCRLEAPESGLTPRVAVTLRSNNTRHASTPGDRVASSASSNADELPFEPRQRVQILTVRSASEIFLHTAATKCDATIKHAQLQDVYMFKLSLLSRFFVWVHTMMYLQKGDAAPIVCMTHVGELYVINVKGAYCRVKMLRRTSDGFVAELIDTGAVRELPADTEFRVLLPTLRYKPTCIGPCRLAGEFLVEEWLSLAATNHISSLIYNAGNVEAELRPKGSRYEVTLWDLSTTSINEQFAESFESVD